MIRLDGLRFRYPEGDFELSLPELEIASGQKVAMVGASGGGKTTLLHLLAGITTPDAGRVRVDGVEVSALGDAERRRFRITQVGFVFQDFELVDYLSVFDNVVHPYRIHRALDLDEAVRARARELLERVGLSDKLHRFVDQLSQGERQRVAICRALITEPRLLLADEPTGNLDPETRDRVLDLLFDYVDRDGDATLLAVTHDHGSLDRYDRVVDLVERVKGGRDA